MKQKKRVVDSCFRSASPEIFVSSAAFFIISLTLFLVGCAPAARTVQPAAGMQDEAVRAEATKQKEAAFATHMKRVAHVFDTAFPLLAEAAALDPSQGVPTCGFFVHNIESYSADFRDAAARYFNVDKQIAVSYVHPQFPAAAAGLRVGDNILSIKGKPLAGATKEELKKILAEMKPVGGNPLDLTIDRNGEVIQMNIEGKSYCSFPVLLFTSDNVNAFSDGKHILLTTGMYRMTQTDEELAFILSHEIAHNLMKHGKQKAEKAAPGTVLDVALAITLGINTRGAFGNMVAAPYSKDFEKEADYVGLYLAARAGYDISEAANFWRRMAVEHPSSIERSYSNTHPTTPERFVAIERTIKEINEKKQLGMPLIPDTKMPGPSAQPPPSSNTESPLHGSDK
jgi:membrane-associated protease RseP (regulator of RpoE activity)